jgi:hypothetical protein
MPACPHRGWAANDSNCTPKNSTTSSKEMDEKLKKLMADRNALDQRLTTPIEKINLNTVSQYKS